MLTLPQPILRVGAAAQREGKRHEPRHIGHRHQKPLYTAEERRRRDSSGWTLVQGILAPVQFFVFLVSLGLVLRCLLTGQGAFAATLSVVAKTLVLYAIMITGSIWEKAVFGRYFLARAFFWEDLVGIVVIGLHTAYLVVLMTDALSVRGQLALALAAYSTYIFNAAQFVLKLRAARRQAAVGARSAAVCVGPAT